MNFRNTFALFGLFLAMLWLFGLMVSIKRSTKEETFIMPAFHGDQDALIPACYARQMANLIPDSEFVLLPECGHNVFVEKPDVIVPLVTEFLMQSRSRKSRKTEDNQHAMD